METMIDKKANQEFDIHWLPLTLDGKYLQDVAKLAEAYGVSAVHLSHRLVHHADEVRHDEERLERVRDAVRMFRASGLDVWCWTHEVSKPPEVCIGRDGRLQLEHPALWAYLEQKYEEVLVELLPGLRGLVLTFAETQFEVYKEHKVSSLYTGEDAREYKTGKLVDALNGICRKHGVRLAIRDFVYRQPEIDSMLKAIAAADDEVEVMSKCVPHDWQPYYPDNPVIGRTGRKRQWVEFDLGHEYEMQTALPFAEPDLLWRRIRDARTAGVETFCLRLDRYDGNVGSSAIYKPWGRLELLVFSQCAARPGISWREIVAEWEATQFPGAGEVVMLATEVIRRMLFPQKLWLANHSNLPSFNYAQDHLKGGNADRLPIWTGSAVDALAETFCDRPNRQWYDFLCAETEKNAVLLQRIDAIMKVRPAACQASDEQAWQDGISALHAWEELFRLYQQAYFGIRLLENEPGAITVSAITEAIDRLEEACGRFRENHPDFMLTGAPAWEMHGLVIRSLRDRL
ncbi:HAD family hydrolase [Paenibacillus roseipurpureus]|uniref:Uncharacterized protein n=1 Tax=Paenibacillus roseopurpureus TaxID=2918901 RepID=A0AA96LSK6_9BACL|nr:hypothetical protein [Paenibacillus sp. MBLB1832]WNR45294.1 hypothetical protein MJB10_03925 [Paenibacillus sp. MBLB1832]